jgi:hypothetical protein
MTINSHITEFAGLPVANFDPDRPVDVAPGVAWRLRLHDSPENGGEFAELAERFLAAVDPGDVRALIVGDRGEAYEELAPGDLLVRLAPRLTGMRALRHHYIGPELAARPVAELPGVEVDPADVQKAGPNGVRYVAVSE